MLRLDLAREPRWLDLGHGVRVLVAPLSTSMMIAARRDVEAAIVDAEGADNEAIGAVMAKALARLAVLDWEGVGDGEGNPVPPTPEGIDALLNVWPIFDAWQSRYVAKGLLLQREGNGSAPLPNGSSAGAPTTAPIAPAPAPSAPGA